MTQPLQAKVLIGRQLVETEMVEVRNPARRDEIVGYVARAGERELEQCIEMAAEAFPAWSRLGTAERGDYIARAIPAWNATLMDRAVLLTREQGKVLWESIADCRGPAGIAEYFLKAAPDVLAPEVTRDERGTIQKKHVPFGVTAVIAPWNTPVYLAFQHVIPALISGNTVIVKPPENAPLALWWSLEILAQHLPSGVLNIVPGSGSRIGAALAAHPVVRKVLFTGSYEVGSSVLAASAQQIKSVGLELGGNDPAIILDDFEMTDRDLQEIALGVFTLTGQICFNIKRIYVPERLFVEFVRRFCDVVDQITVGDGLREESVIGPVNNEKELLRLQRLLGDVKDSGATVRQLGSLVEPAEASNGYFMLPHVVTDVDPEHPLVTEEQFGPIIPVLPYTSLDAVIDDVNSSEFGLCGSIWSADVDRAFEVGSAISAGTVFVNVHRIGASDMTMPFGGTKQSGLGRTHGAEVLLECTEPQMVVHRLDTDKFPGRHLADQYFATSRTEGTHE